MKKWTLLLIAVMMVGIFSLNVFALIYVDMYKLIDARPGEVTRNSIMIVNPDSEKAIITVWKEDWRTVAVNGEIIKEVLGTTGVVSQSLAPYLTFRSSTEFEIPGNSSVEFRFETRLPTNKVGSYWTAIVVCQEPSETVRTPGAGEISVQSRFAFYSKIIRFDSQNDDLKPWISFLSTPVQITLENFQKGLEFQATMENIGQVAFFFPCQLVIYQGLNRDQNPIVKVGGIEAVTEVAPFYFLPGETMDIKIALPFKLPPGVYTAKFKILMQMGPYAPVAWREFRITGG